MIKPCNIVIDVPDVERAAAFYERLLGWKRIVSHAAYIQIDSLEGGASLGFQLDEGYTPPSWPESDGHGQMLHIDFLVDDAVKEKQRALELGATLAPRQFMPEAEGVTLLDPFGHPFCLIRGWYGHDNEKAGV